MNHGEHSGSASGRKNYSGSGFERLWLQELNAYTPTSRILQTWKPVSYMDSGTFSHVFMVMHRGTGKLAVLKYVPNPIKVANCGSKGSQEDLFNQARYAASKREAEIMNRFRGEKHIVQYLEEPEYLERTFENTRGEMVTQYAVLICMPLYKSHKEWAPIVAGSRKGCLRLGMEISRALECFEAKGVYHRDIKPGNILMDDQYHFYLSDVGEAKLESEFTTTGFHGTRPYMAPEVYNQEGERTKMRSDHRSDIYSLGIILYRLFNHQQFPLMTEAGTLTDEATASYREYEKKHQLDSSENSYLTDSERARILRYDGSVLPPPKEADAQLAEVILRACAYEKEERYQRAADLTRALQYCAEGKELPPELRRAKKKAKKAQKTAADSGKKSKALVLAIGAAAMAAVIAGTGFMNAGKFSREALPTPTPIVTTAPTATPALEPTATPTLEPTATPTLEPTATPTLEPTATPTLEPTATPTLEPTATPTLEPTATPTLQPTATPTLEPTATPNPILVTEKEIHRIEGTGISAQRFELEIGITDGKIVSARCTEHSETPGMGAELLTDKALSVLIGQDVETAQIDAVSGVTLTSRGINQALDTLKTVSPDSLSSEMKALIAQYGKEGYVLDDPANYEYKMLDDETIAITKYSGNVPKLIIPDMIDGKKVISIDGFDGSKTLKRVIVPEGIGTLDIGAFSSCMALTEVILPESLRTIRNCAFSDCPLLATIRVPQGVTDIGYQVFNACPKLSVYALRNSLAETYAKENNIPVVLLDSNDEAVASAADQKTIQNPQPTTPANLDVFTYAENSDGGITITKYIGKDYEYVVIPEEINGKKVNVIGRNAFEYSTITGVSIPKTVKVIDNSAFWACDKIKTVEIPEGVEILGPGCFGYCDTLEQINIPASITNISAIVQGSANLKRILVAEDNTWISVENGFLIMNTHKGRYINGVIGQPDEVVFPNDITVLYDDVFRDQEKLKSIIIPEGVTTILSWCFRGCDNLTTVHLPSTIDSIGEDAFSDCPKLRTIYGSNHVAESLASALGIDYVHVDTFEIVDGSRAKNPDETVRPSPTPLSSAFSYSLNSEGITITDYHGLGEEHVTIPDKIDGKYVTEIGVEAFANSLITDVSFPAGLKIIENRAFLNCDKLKLVALPEGIKKLGAGCFGECDLLERISIPASVDYMGAIVYGSANVKEISVSPKSTWISEKEGILVTNTAVGKVIIGVADVSDEIEIPNGISIIWDKVFRNQYNLKRISITEGVKEIRSMCFTGCVNLEMVQLPSTIDIIGDDAFLDCPKLKTIYGSNDTARNLAAELGVEYVEIPAKGMRSDKVLEIKGQLKALGYYSANASYDDEFNDIMSARLREFQKNNDLRETGRYDLDTMEKLNGGGNLVRGSHGE